ncbi:MAG: thioredoxin domain-containing protein [Parcubacteria group bacterium]|jgi:protein-disulfide isomerase
MSEENKIETTETTETTEEVVVEDKNDDKKKIKNLISLVILLGGLFVGSLFVDFSQLIKGGGISQKVLNNKDIFQLDGKTWVAYSDPMISVSILNDDTCKDCNVDEVILSLRKVIPTMLSSRIDYSSAEGKKMIEDFEIKSLPAFVFGKEVEDTELFGQAKALFIEKNGKYLLDSAKAGLPAGKYLKTPTIGDNSIKFGPDDAKVKLVEFSDFQCPYCQLFQKTVDTIVKEYGDKVQFVFKNFPLDSIHPRAKAAAMAAECANEQGKFMDYSDKLFVNQKIWGATKDNKLFIGYASQLKMDVTKFTQCVNDEKYKNKIESDLKEGSEFGISGTPAMFINDKFKNGAVEMSELKSIIDAELNGEQVTESAESDEKVEETK